MKKVLILCRDYPPLMTVAAQRIDSWVKYLPNHNIHPIVIAPSWPEGITQHNQKFVSKNEKNTVEEGGDSTVYRIQIDPNSLQRWVAKKGLNKGKLIRKFLTLKHLIRYYLGFKNDELYPIYSRAREILKSESIDLILSSGEPYNLFKFSTDLSKEFGTPWVADFRDEWSDNHTKQRSDLSKMLIRFFEKQWIKSASALISVSEPITERLNAKFGKDSFVVMNGFDQNFTPTESQKSDEYFELVYSGTIYQAEYLDVLKEGLEILTKKNLPYELRLVFIGSELNETKGTNKLKELSNTFSEISFEGLLTYEDYMSRINKSDAALNMIPGSLAQGIYGTKIFDYLSADLPVIHIETMPQPLPQGFNKLLSAANDASTFASIIMDFMNKKKDGVVYQPAYSTDWKVSFSRQHQAKKLSEVIFKILDEK